MSMHSGSVIGGVFQLGSIGLSARPLRFLTGSGKTRGPAPGPLRRWLRISAAKL
jgi:hypothetical protein